ncbi:ribokinase, partial [Vibrio parahaemolyticus EKP-028]
QTSIPTREEVDAFLAEQ